MSSLKAGLFSGAALAVASVLFFAGCGSIETAPMPSSSASLTPNPDHIYIAPFNIETGKWLVGHEGVDLGDFKKAFQTNFMLQLQNRLIKLAPTEARWVDDLPDHGWMVAGDFITVFQGSRALRTVIGGGMGETTMQTNVYVYDLSISKTQYILSFRTGVQDGNTGAGSGSAPSGISAAGEPVSTALGLGSGLKLDTTRTCREIVATLSKYL